ncbi:MAG: AmmeMemoRadiSam system protein B [Marinifilaceae bacterium]
MTVRKPSVAGTFYPEDPKKLKGMIQDLLNQESESIDYSLASCPILGGVVPHAGYMYSGYQAVHFYEILRYSKVQVDTVIILNPNHTGFGEGEVSLPGCDQWETPLGMVSIDQEFAAKLNYPSSSMAHLQEHSAEVQLPFLQVFLEQGFKVLPISMNQQTPESAGKLARAIVETNRDLKRKLLVIASSDFSHYVKPEEGMKLDHLVVDAILHLDTKRVYREVRKHRISVCGYGPIMALMEYALMCSDHPRVKVLRQGNSGDISPSDSVVDYFSMLFYQEKG